MKERYLLEEEVGENGFSLITDYDGNDEHVFDVNIKSGDILPVLPLRNMVLFPGVFLPITVGRKASLKLVREAEKKHKDIAVICQRSAHTEDPKLEDLHNVGTVGRIVRVLEMPDQTTTVILQGMKRLRLKDIVDTHPYLKGEVELLEEDVPNKDDKEFQALVETCKDLTMRYIKSSEMHQDSSFAIKNISNPMFLINFICANLPFKKDEKMDLLSINSLRERTYHLLEILNREVQLAEIKASIQMRAREDIDQQQREYFLQQQIKTIQDELGGSGQEQEIEEMRLKAVKMHWNAEVRDTFLKELAKLERTHPQSPDFSVHGRIIKSLIKAGASNPVFILDEIDKVSADRQGDPSSALLEVLDPEQNTSFHDNFLDVDYDLSKVLFIATANNLNTIPGPLLDRMELIEVSGYITEEKVEIARKHLLPKELEANGLKKTDIKIPKDTLEAIIESYTRESGVRELEKKIGKILRKSARQYATDGYFAKSEIKPTDLYEFLGAPEYTRDKYQGNDYAGVVTGLAWTAVGGEILFVETSLSRGKGARLTLTGNLGDVMKESAMLALEYIKAHASILDLNEDIFDNWNIHIHVPEGAIPKDGPSAGITMATSLASALTQRKVKANLAMTGEITLRGKVLPVGGIKEKILAAKRAGIKEIIMSAENKKNIDEIQDIYLKGLQFHYVNDIKEVFAIALTNEKVADAIDLSVKKPSQE